MGFTDHLHGGHINKHVWIMWKDSFIVEDIGMSDQHITVKIKHGVSERELVCSFVYASVDRATRTGLWKDLGDLMPHISVPWLAMGDFNVISDTKEKHGGNKPDSKAMFEFNEFLTRAGFSDMGFHGSPYTWSNNQQGRSRIWERLDRVVGNGLAVAAFQNLKVHHLVCVSSDHCPLLLNWKDAYTKRCSFKFLGAWISHEGFMQVISDAWAGKLHKSPIINLALKLKRVRAALNQWNWSKFGDVRVKLKEATKHLEELELKLQTAWFDTTNKEIIDTKGEISDLIRYNFSILEEKARVGWLRDGDRNSGFFHAAIKARRSQNCIRLRLEDESFTDDVDSIGAKAEEYFRGLFGDCSDQSNIEVEDLIHPSITQEQNDNLCKVPSEVEIKEAIDSMNHANAPGPDGLTGKFYSSCWEIIKKDTCEAIEGFFHGLQLPKAISSTSVILLPKIKRANSMDQIRPISLCNFAHKIISSILNSRLKIVLPMLVGLEQSGFVEGRSISECIGLAHDIIRDINHKAFGGNVMVKLDMSKAYDRLSWRFLLRVFRAFGFAERWCDLIFRNISNCWYSVAWGGKDFGFFKSNRGVRQGDPLSPSLFVIAMEYFSRMINNAVLSKTIRPYQTKGNSTLVHHLMYADDLLIFSNDHKGSIAKLLGIITKFCCMSGQQLNPVKSRVFFSKFINDARRKELIKSTKFTAGQFPTKYLGAPLFPGRPKISYFQHMEETIRGRIAEWYKSFLSMSGRTTLISSVLGSLHIHILSIIPVPKTCLKRIESLMKNFLWDNGDNSRRHWIGWKKISAPKDEGGLGIKLLADTRSALMHKLAWRYLLNNSLWATYARTRYKERARGSSIWQMIQPMIIKLRKDSFWDNGRGDIKIDHICEWYGLKPPRDLAYKDLKEVMFSSDLKQEFVDLFPTSSNFSIEAFDISNKPDQLRWKGSDDDYFSARSFFKVSRAPQPRCSFFASIWQAWIPPKISTLVWKIMHKVVPTDDNIRKIGIQIPSRCTCCIHHRSESWEHLFFTSDIAKGIWDLLANLFDRKIPHNLHQFKVFWLANQNLQRFIDCLADGP
ncbi:unnamed protein product [Rhodiola kirilowii]